MPPTWIRQDHHMTSTERPRLTKTLEGYETTIGRVVYRITPSVGRDHGRWTMTEGVREGVYSQTPAGYYGSLADVRDALAEIAAE